MSKGATPSGSGCSAEPEPISVVSADTASIPSAVKCGLCGFPICRNEVGVRHFGFYVAHSEHGCRDILRNRINDLGLALDYALGVLGEMEPPDSRAVSDEFVAAAAIAANLDGNLNECRTILAQAIEARRAADSEAGAVEDESAVPEGNAP